MSHNAPDRDPDQLPVRRMTWWERNKAPALIVMGAVASFALLAAGWYFGIPSWLLYAGISVLFVAPWFALTFGVWSWSRLRNRMNVHVQFDESGDRAGVVLLDRDEHRAAEIDGDRLPTRTGFNSNTDIYISTGHEIEQREVRGDDGVSFEEQRVISTPWEGWVSPWRVAERWSAYQASLHFAEDTLREAREVRAKLDIRSLEATDDAIHSVVKAAEQDQFVSDESDPFGHDLARDRDGDVDDPARDRAGDPDPSPESDPDLSDLLAADGGESDD